MLLGVCSAGVLALSQTMTDSTSTENMNPATAAVNIEQETDSSVAARSTEHPVEGNPYEKLEQMDSHMFQDRVVRYERVKAASFDSTLPRVVREFAMAAQYYYQEDWVNAYASYYALVGRDSTLDGNVILRMAKSLLMLGDYDRMRQTLSMKKGLEKNPAWAREAAFLRVQALAQDSTVSKKAKADSLKSFIDKNPKADYINPIKKQYAQALEVNGERKAAKRIYMQLLANEEFKDSAFASITKLRSVEGEPETFEEKVAFAKMSCGKIDASVCMNLLDSIQILEAKPDSSGTLFIMDQPTRIILREKRAEALRGLKKIDESIAQYLFLIDSVEARKGWIQTTVKLMKGNAKYAAEVTRLNALLKETNKYSKGGGNNLWLRGFEFEQEEKYEQALECYRELASPKYKKSNYRQWGMFRVGLIYFKQEMWQEAVEAFVEGSKEKDLWSGNASRMFLGDTYMKLGQDSLARLAYLSCIRDFPLSFYAHRSRVKLVEQKLLDEKDVPFAHGVDMSHDETMAWIRKVQNVKEANYSRQTYERIRTLFLYGFSDQAFNLYNEIRKNYASRLDFLYEYGKLFYEMGEIAAGYRLAQQFVTIIDRRLLLEPPLAVLQYLYPTPFKDQVKFQSGNRIDPFFVYSVMRQESIFNFEIRSPANARGLLQIIPSTGKMLAKQEGIENFNPNLLYNPYLNIRLGIRYLVDLKAEYKDDYMYVLGNYNAGPRPTKRWQAADAKWPWDVRVENVSYRETRDYIKRCMGNYWIYQEIYDEL